jgi:hypothetical protein
MDCAKDLRGPQTDMKFIAQHLLEDHEGCEKHRDFRGRRSGSGALCVTQNKQSCPENSKRGWPHRQPSLQLGLQSGAELPNRVRTAKEGGLRGFQHRQRARENLSVSSSRSISVGELGSPSPEHTDRHAQIACREGLISTDEAQEKQGPWSQGLANTKARAERRVQTTRDKPVTPHWQVVARTWCLQVRMCHQISPPTRSD